jgi:RNA polymerase sigma-70 factor, ECF subfamily
VSPEELVERYARFLLRYASVRVGPGSEAEDVVAETFAVALGKLSRCPRPVEPESLDDPVRAWLIGIARRKVADVLRRRGRESQDSVESAAAPSPAEAVLSADASARLRKMLFSLSENYREVLLMKYAEELSLSEIGLALGKSPNAVGQLLHRARAAARRQSTEEDWT